MSTIQTADARTYTNGESLELIDFIAVGVATAVLGGYHIFYSLRNQTHLHQSLSSHVDFQQISWAKFVFSDETKKINLIQNHRSGLQIINQFSRFLVIAAAGVMAVGIAKWNRDFVTAGVRYIVPTVFLFVSLYNVYILLIGMHHLHFSMEVELLSREEQLAFVGFRPENVLDEERTKLVTATLLLQNNEHFRVAWRTMVVGLIAILWSMSPVALMVGSVLLAWNMYLCDFPFSPNVQKMLKRKRSEVFRDAQNIPAFQIPVFTQRVAAGTTFGEEVAEEMIEDPEQQQQDEGEGDEPISIWDREEEEEGNSVVVSEKNAPFS